MSRLIELLNRPYICSVPWCNFKSDLKKMITYGINEFAIWFHESDKNLLLPICFYHTGKEREFHFVPGIVKLPEILYSKSVDGLTEWAYITSLKKGLSCENCNFDPCFHACNTPLSTHRINNGKMVFTMWWDELEKKFLCFERMMSIESWLRRKLRKEGPTGRFKTAIDYITEQVYSPIEKGITQSFADLVQIKK